MGGTIIVTRGDRFRPECSGLVRGGIVSDGAGQPDDQDAGAAGRPVPRGTVHAPQVVGDAPGKVLIVFVPGGTERAFDEFAALAAETGAPPDPSDPRMVAIVERSASSLVPPG